MEWAELCGDWAFQAAKAPERSTKPESEAGKLADAEEALRLKWRLAGGQPVSVTLAVDRRERTLRSTGVSPKTLYP